MNGTRSDEIAIRTEHLTRDFETVRAVDDISIAVPAGTVFGFLGPNGAGKTTTIRLLLGLLEPTSGRAEVFGLDTQRHAGAIRERSGTLLEHEGLYERLTAEDNLEFYGRVWRIPRAERRARIKELLTRAGLWDRRGEAVRKWSRGMRRKLGVARAVFHRPALLFLDEPTAGLDPVATAALREDLEALATQEGVTIFLTTHILSEAEKLCTSIGVIRRGRVQAFGTLADLRTRGPTMLAQIDGRGITDTAAQRVRELPGVARATVTDGRMMVELTRSTTSVAPVVAALVGAGAEIEEVRRTTPTLEELFLTLMGDDSDGADG